MRKIIWVMVVTFPFIIPAGEENCFHRRVKNEPGNWQDLRQKAEEIDLEALPVQELTTYFFKDEIFRNLNKWMSAGRITSEDLSALMTIIKSLGMNPQKVEGYLNTREGFRQLLDEIVTETIQKLTDIIQEGNERYYEVVKHAAFPILPYLKESYDQLMDKTDSAARVRRRIILELAFLDNVTPSSQLAEFLWEVITADCVSVEEKRLALREIGYHGNFEIFTQLLRYIGKSEELGVAEELVNEALNTMAERVLGEGEHFRTPYQLADMVRKKGSVILRDRDGSFIEVVKFVPTWIPGLWWVVTSQPEGAYLITWKRFMNTLAVQVDWSTVKNYLPPWNNE